MFIQSNFSDFMNEITKRYHEYKEDVIMPSFDDDLCKYLKETDIQGFFRYQEFLHEYIKNLDREDHGDTLNQRGVLVYHGLGSGKTTSAILMNKALREGSKKGKERKTIIMIPAGLLWDPWIKELKGVGGIKGLDTFSSSMKRTQVLEYLGTHHKIYFVFYNAHAIKGGWSDKLLGIPTRIDQGISSRSNPFDDSVVIIDEMHNLTNMIANRLIEGRGEHPLYTQLMESENTRVIGMTGTPIINRPFEIAIIANIIRGIPHPGIQFHLDNDYFNSMFIDESGHGLKNKRMLSRRLNGLISYYRGINESVFADPIYKDEYLSMKENQRNGYEIAMAMESDIGIDIDNIPNQVTNIDYSGTNTFMIRTKASNAIFPDYIFNQKTLNRMRLTKNGKPINKESIETKGGDNLLLNTKITKEHMDKVLSILDNDSMPLHIDHELENISIKIHRIIRKTIQSNGPVLIYSRFEGIYGIALIAAALKQNGFSDYDEDKGNGEGLKYMIWSGQHKNIRSKDIFNLPENKDGSIIKVFLVTGAGKEGINLMAIRQIHILEPWWNNNVIKQIIGRGIRICSHAHVSPNEFIDFSKDDGIKRYPNKRIVNVFRYYSFIDMRKEVGGHDKQKVMKRMKQTSVDFIIKSIADKKERQENLITNVMQSVSIDCEINKYRNGGSHCFIDHNYDDYFKAWNTVDAIWHERGNKRREYRKHMVNGISYLIDILTNDVYIMPKDEVSINSPQLKKIGKYRNGTIIMDENQFTINKPLTIASNLYKYVLEEKLGHKDIYKKSILDISLKPTSYTFLFPYMFKKCYHKGCHDESDYDLPPNVLPYPSSPSPPFTHYINYEALLEDHVHNPVFYLELNSYNHRQVKWITINNFHECDDVLYTLSMIKYPYYYDKAHGFLVIEIKKE